MIDEDLRQSEPANLTRMIRPAKAITPSITNTLKRDKTSRSDNIKEDK